MDDAEAKQHFTDEEVQTLSDTWYSAARSCQWSSDFIGTHTLENLQGIILMSVLMNNRDRADAAWALLGAAIKMAQGLGLSRLGAEQQSVDGRPLPMWKGRWESVIQREIGRRIWWNLVFLDWSLAPSYNYACSIQPDQSRSSVLYIPDRSQIRPPRQYRRRRPHRRPAAPRAADERPHTHVVPAGQAQVCGNQPAPDLAGKQQQPPAVLVHPQRRPRAAQGNAGASGLLPARVQPGSRLVRPEKARRALRKDYPLARDPLAHAPSAPPVALARVRGRAVCVLKGAVHSRRARKSAHDVGQHWRRPVPRKVVDPAVLCHCLGHGRHYRPAQDGQARDEEQGDRGEDCRGQERARPDASHFAGVYSCQGGHQGDGLFDE